MADGQEDPLVIYGLPDNLNTFLKRDPPPTERSLKKLSREEILSILISNGIYDDRIRTKKQDMMHHLHQLILNRGVRISYPDEEQMQLDQQTANALARPRDCCACLSQVATILFQGCNHLCICATCRQRMLEAQNVLHWMPRPRGQRTLSCPICRHQTRETELMSVIYNA